jgi:hypothetical protein
MINAQQAKEFTGKIDEARKDMLTKIQELSNNIRCKSF